MQKHINELKKLYPMTAIDRKRDKLMDDLNLIDEQAEHGNTDYDEDVARAKAYERVADFIYKALPVGGLPVKKNKKK